MPLSTSLFGMQYLSHRTHSAHKQANNKTLSISAHLPKTKQASTGSRNLRNRIFDSNICKYWIEAWECKRYGDDRNGELCNVVDCWIRNVYWIMLIMSAFFPKYFISIRFLLCRDAEALSEREEKPVVASWIYLSSSNFQVKMLHHRFVGGDRNSIQIECGFHQTHSVLWRMKAHSRMNCI